MSIMDKVVAVVTPPEGEQQRREARERARAAAGPDDWLSLVLQHHEQIEAAFDAVGRATDALSRRRAQKELAVLLTGHSNAEESVLYPANSRFLDLKKKTPAAEQEMLTQRFREEFQRYVGEDIERGDGSTVAGIRPAAAPAAPTQRPSH